MNDIKERVQAAHQRMREEFGDEFYEEVQRIQNERPAKNGLRLVVSWNVIRDSVHTHGEQRTLDMLRKVGREA